MSLDDIRVIDGVLTGVRSAAPFYQPVMARMVEFAKIIMILQELVTWVDMGNQADVYN